MTLHPQYLTDEKGRKTAVLLPYSEYEQLVRSTGKTATKHTKTRKTAGVSDDWFDKLTKSHQNSVLKGLKDIDQENTSTHKEVSAKVKAVLKKVK